MILEDLWPRLHGASTHLPIALVPVAAGFEFLALFVRGEELRRHLRAAAAFLLPLAALASLASVLSGFGISRGEVLGQGILRTHHLFVWPSFALLIGLATWRTAAGPDISNRALTGFRFVLILNAVLILAAGYWGGELALSR